MRGAVRLVISTSCFMRRSWISLSLMINGWMRADKRLNDRINVSGSVYPSKHPKRKYMTR